MAEQDDPKTQDSQVTRMPDWLRLVHERFAVRRSGPEIELEVAEELASHLEDTCAAELHRGFSEQDAATHALGEVRNWRRLAREINDARGGHAMLKDRIRRLWLPGMVPMIVAMGMLFVGSSIASEPRMLSATPKAVILFYFGWLFILLPAIGGLAAYWSRRAGGSVANRALAALFPAGTMLAVLCIVLVASLLSPGNMTRSRILTELVRAGLDAVALPALAFLVGAAPFLRNKTANDDLSVRVA